MAGIILIQIKSVLEMLIAMCKIRAYDNISYLIVSNQKGNIAKKSSWY